MPSNQRLKTMARRRVDQLIRTRNFRARSERIETGVVVKSHKGRMSAWKGERGDSCSFSHGNNRGQQQAQSSSPAPKAQTQIDGRRPSQGNGSQGRESYRKQRSKSVQKSYLKGNCTNPSCYYWHPPVCQNCKSESGCTFGDKCLLRPY